MIRNNEYGFSTPLAMIVIFSLCLLLCSLSLLLFSKQKNVSTFKQHYELEKKINSICENVVTDFQIFVSNEIDNNYTIETSDFYTKYASYMVEITDISTGINTELLKSEILEQAKIRNLLEKYDSDIKSDYGWINPKYVNNDFYLHITENFNNKSLFPLVNNMPLYNVYFMNLEFIDAILSICKVQRLEELKEDLLKNIYSSQLDSKMLKSIAKEYDNAKILDFLGIRTSFWKIVLKNEEFNIELVLAAIPDQQNMQKIKEYILIERNITYKGGLKW